MKMEMRMVMVMAIQETARERASARVVLRVAGALIDMPGLLFRVVDASSTLRSLCERRRRSGAPKVLQYVAFVALEPMLLPPYHFHLEAQVTRPPKQVVREVPKLLQMPTVARSPSDPRIQKAWTRSP